MITKKEITTFIYEVKDTAHFKISFEDNQRSLIKDLCKSALDDLKKATLPATINVAKSGAAISFQVLNTKVKKAMNEMIIQAIKDL